MQSNVKGYHGPMHEQKDTPWAVECSAFRSPQKSKSLPPIHTSTSNPLLTIIQHESTMKRCICALNNAATRKPTLPALASRQLHTPATTPILPATISHPYSSTRFTIPPLLPFPNATSPYESQGKGKGKGKGPENPKSNEEEVDDAEWQMRVGEFIRALVSCIEC